MEVDKKPSVVCLCGSTRFWTTFIQAGIEETLSGKIVLGLEVTLGILNGDINENPEKYAATKQMFDDLHLRRIDLADEVLILNVKGYIGESTSLELEYAVASGKKVRYWEDEPHIT